MAGPQPLGPEGPPDAAPESPRARDGLVEGGERRPEPASGRGAAGRGGEEGSLQSSGSGGRAHFSVSSS